MNIRFETIGDKVSAIAEVYSAERQTERIVAHGTSIADAVEKLIIRFKELQEMAYEELQRFGFVRTVRVESEVAS